MSLLMEALRKAEEEKKKAQAQAREPTPAVPAPTSAFAPLEPALEPLIAPRRDPAPATSRTHTDERSDERLREALAISSNRVPDYVPGTRDGQGTSPGREPAGTGRGTWPGVASGDPTSPTTERAIAAGAHTVFAAKRRRGGNSLYRVVAAGALLLFLVLAGTAYYYSMQTPSVRPVAAAAVAALPARVPITLAPPAEAAPVPVPPGSAPETGSPPPAAESGTDIAPARPAPGRTAPEPAFAPSVVAGARPDLEETAGLLRISRRSVSVALDRNLVDGYAALRRGDLASAQTAYRNALGKDALSRDALLGLAAVALRQGDSTQAQMWYRERLRADPDDVIAIAGLAALGGDDAADASRLRGLIERQPGVAPLHFALGRTLARQQRWPEAQQQFFDAYRNATDNADYAFNLAVSLDRLGQAAAAADYYRKALALVAAGTPASFDEAAARARLDALSAP